MSSNTTNIEIGAIHLATNSSIHSDKPESDSSGFATDTTSSSYDLSYKETSILSVSKVPDQAVLPQQLGNDLIRKLRCMS